LQAQRRSPPAGRELQLYSSEEEFPFLTSQLRVSAAPTSFLQSRGIVSNLSQAVFTPATGKLDQSGSL
jgi:hypothetical protein